MTNAEQDELIEKLAKRIDEQDALIAKLTGAQDEYEIKLDAIAGRVEALEVKPEIAGDASQEPRIRELERRAGI